MKLCFLNSVPNQKVGCDFAIQLLDGKKEKSKEVTVSLGVIKEIYKSYIVVDVERYKEIIVKDLIEKYPKYFAASQHPYTTIFI